MCVTFRPSPGEWIQSSAIRGQRSAGVVLRQANENPDVNCEKKRNQKTGDQEPRQSRNDGRAGFGENQSLRSWRGNYSQSDRIDQICYSDDVPDPYHRPNICGPSIGEPCDRQSGCSDKNISPAGRRSERRRQTTSRIKNYKTNAEQANHVNADEKPERHAMEF